MSELKQTRNFGDLMTNADAKDVLKLVYKALQTKGYDPVSQLVGYILSGDPTYITSYADARYQISRVERDEILEVLLKNYIDTEFAK
ncbi:MAG: IreB family regulatory phosphoprotein [Lachnospiraceae bacterium]|nr:IreB family regulatory phosphoprotein [Lachnospiraceae bacterium]MBQ6242674.1 IreB family regulatory phosphoprotein [Lachnospiraceae bacterium]